ncbi:DoxX family membrane protein [Segetibacter sp. 3557_3]|uniref:BT_3928 family protein n=1 Tax=Segetibacter sp. 3557_3 TaxID=2547429 RepID=UPI001058E3C0|nr:BT_3928 family protein [Segetibacter sp. 3557_3]TDH29164.1 DoxX family membrane protein [Segetibacter sp. 3557_3]
MKIALNVSRVLVGLLFIFSGLVKANDPLGLSYKMQEFFEVWGWQSLNDYTLFFSLMMNGFEIVAGVAVLLGWRMRLFSWLLLLLIIFFTFLTGYAVFSGKIHACGCFGDCIPLSPMQSFLKDLVLLALIVYIFSHRNRIVPVFRSATCGILIILTGLFAGVMQWYVLKHLPIVDCLPYKVGNNITEKMKLPAGAVPDSIAMTFVYLHNGKKVEFDGDHFPDDFNDSTYKFVERREVLVRPASAQPAITDFYLSSVSGTDTTQAILSQENHYVLVFVKDLATAKTRWEDNLPSIVDVCKEKNIPLFIVTAAPDLIRAHINTLPNVKASDVNFLVCDYTVIKTAARENPTYVIMRQANILGKYAAADHRKAYTHLKSLK